MLLASSNLFTSSTPARLMLRTSASLQRLSLTHFPLVGSRASPKRQHSGSSTQMAAAAGGAAPPRDPIVQYVVIRKDLWTEHGWPLGSVVAQACHASSAAMWLFRDDEATKQYCAPENIDNMHKVVLEVKDEAGLRALAAKLDEASVGHKLWVEQPENFPTCLATKPCVKSTVAAHFKKYQLCKTPLGAGGSSSRSAAAADAKT